MDITIKRIEIKVIPHNMQYYPTVGDWIFNQDTLCIVVSDMKNDSYHLLITIHELIEAMLCRRAGIADADVTNFDMQFEAWRRRGTVGDFDEPGNDPRAPYYEQHQKATEVEKKLAEILGVDWDVYDLAVNSL